jgi:hypothetical protein
LIYLAVTPFGNLCHHYLTVADHDRMKHGDTEDMTGYMDKKISGMLAVAGKGDRVWPPGARYTRSPEWIGSGAEP